MNKGQTADIAAAGVIGAMFPETPIFEPNRRYILPAGIDARNIEIGTDNAMSEDALRAADIQVFDDPRFTAVADPGVTYASLESRGVWINNSKGTGLQLMATLADGYIIPVLLADGSEYSLTFDEAATFGFTTVPFLGTTVRVPTND